MSRPIDGHTRRAYTIKKKERRSSTRKNNPGIGRLRKGDLTRFGYDHVKTMSEGRRHLAIARAVKAYGALSVWRKLNAVYVYTRNTAPASSAVFKADRDWVREYYGLV